ncbi:aminoadipate-semialdehyde dehydrogenase isoform X2 [Rhynchophorus ferrugineus]|uniref:aminoadipate-semialdehyde dehydrogenase isoform X2 n=1 Tax=Rhynchophorus ferrugineus TaxID=354439 RepID=UPI003FCD603F
MESLLSILHSGEYSTKNAIILCDHNKILHELTFGDLRSIAITMTEFFKPYFTIKNQCIGIITETNLYIPSLILSFQVFQCSFVFLQPNIINQTVETLRIQWIISFDTIHNVTETYQLVNSLILNNEHNLQLWKCCEEIDVLNFKDIFCVMQTSGSTGDNKIIKIPHYCIENNAININKVFNITQADVIYWGTPLTFDPSLIEFFLALLHYATLLIIPKYININPSYLYKCLFNIGNITFLQTVPSVFLRFTSKQIADILLHSCLKILAFGGEQFPAEILNYPRKPPLTLYNLYGVTELSCWATIFKIPDDFTSESEVPLGSALDDVFISLFDENQELSKRFGEITVDFIDALTYFPLTSHGKMCHRSLEKYYQGGLQNIELKENHEMFLDVLRQYLPIDKYVNSDQLYDHSFIDLGGSSMLGIQLLSDLEDQIQAHIPDEFINLLFNEQLKSCLEYLKVTRLKRKNTNTNIHKTIKKPKIDVIDSDLVYWKYDMRGCVDASPAGFANSKYCCVCAGSFSGIFIILNTNGEELFKHTFSHEIEATPCISPCGNYIYIGCGNGTMYCINVNTKKIIWEYPTSEKIKSAAVLLESCVVFGSYDSHMYCLFKETGDLIWKTQLNGGIKADIIYNEKQNVLYTATIKGSCYGLGVTGGAICWHYQCNSPIFGSPCMIGNDTIWITVTGKLYCISSEGDLQWTFDVNSNVFSSLINENDLIYFTSHDHCLHELSCSDRKCKIVRKIELNGEISSSPFLYRHNNNLYSICICNNGVLCIVDLNMEAVIFQCALPNESFSSPFIFQEKIFVGCRDNNLYCIDFVKVLSG